jgi:hypothetical protein
MFGPHEHMGARHLRLSPEDVRNKANIPISIKLSPLISDNIFVLKSPPLIIHFEEQKKII